LLAAVPQIHKEQKYTDDNYFKKANKLGQEVNIILT